MDDADDCFRGFMIYAGSAIVELVLLGVPYYAYRRKEKHYFLNDRQKGRKFYFIAGLIFLISGILLLTPLLFPRNDCFNFAYTKWLFIIGNSMSIFGGVIHIHRGWVLPNIDLDPDAEPPRWWKYFY